MKKKIFITIGIIIVLVFIIAVIGLKYVFRVSDRSGITRKADFIMAADSLINIFTAQEDSANARYLDKVLQVTGSVAEITNDTAGYSIILRDSAASEGISCALGKDQNEKVKSIKTGDKIEIKGICAGKLIDVSLNKCTIVKL